MVSRHPSKTILETVPLRLFAVRATPAMLILLCLTLLAFHKIDAPSVEKMRAQFVDVMAPALETLSAPVSALADSVDGIASFRRLKAENIRLSDENARLQQWYESALKLEAENKSLRELLNVRSEPALGYITARVISDPGGAFVKSFLLPVGSRDGVSKGDAVLSGHGLIGRVTEAGDRASRVLLVTDLNSRIPVIVQNTRTRAILAGKNTDILKLERLPLDGGISVGQRVVTSGDGGQLPPDIPIGTISEIGKAGVFVKPLSEVEKATYVQVIHTGTGESLLPGGIIGK